MKAQLSLEFLVYSAIMLAALLIALAFYMKASSEMAETGSYAQLDSFAGAINQNMAYQSSSFIAYVPKGICNASIGNLSITFMNIGFSLDGQLSLQEPEICALSGTLARLNMQQSNGTFVLG